MNELAKFNHHPDSLIDAETEVARLDGLLYEARAALHRALDYRACTPESKSIKRDIRSAIERTGGFFPSQDYTLEPIE